MLKIINKQLRSYRSYGDSIDFIKNHWRNNMTMTAAVKQVAHDRFRAIFLTSLTTIVGLLLLLLETSTQAQLLIPIVASLTFGLLIATSATK